SRRRISRGSSHVGASEVPSRKAASTCGNAACPISIEAAWRKRRRLVIPSTPAAGLAPGPGAARLLELPHDERRVLSQEHAAAEIDEVPGEPAPVPVAAPQVHVPVAPRLVAVLFPVFPGEHVEVESPTREPRQVV